VGDAMGDAFLKLLFINTLEVIKVEPGVMCTPLRCPAITGISEC